MATVAINASPLNCRWIQRGSEMRVSNWTLALCLRGHSRIVSESECARCALWEAPDDHQQNLNHH